MAVRKNKSSNHYVFAGKLNKILHEMAIYILQEKGDIYFMLCLEHCFIWFRDLDAKKIGTEVFG